MKLSGILDLAIRIIELDLKEKMLDLTVDLVVSESELKEERGKLTARKITEAEEEISSLKKETLELLSKVASQESQEKLREHEQNLEAARHLRQHAPKENIIAIISSATSLCSKLYEAHRNNPLLAQMHEGLIQFIQSDEGMEICNHENKEQLLLARERVKGISLERDELRLLNNKSLLCRLFAGVPSEYSLGIINTIISRCTDPFAAT